MTQIRYGMMIAEFDTPALAVLVQRAGFDFAVVDREHGSYDSATLRGLLLTAKLADTPLLVRVPQVDRHAIAEALDLGAAGIVVPHVDTPDEAAAAVRYARYAPLGERGMATMKAHTLYDPAGAPDIVARANAHVRVLVQIESVRAVEHVADIAATPGVDAVVLGPSDLAQDAGVPGRLDHAVVDDAIRAVAGAAARAGIAGAAISSNLGFLERCAAAGFTELVVGSDVGHMLSGARAALARAKSFRSPARTR